MIRVLLLFFSVLSWQGFGQQWPFEYWHEGKMVLEEGDTLKGKIKYDINTDIIQLEQKSVFQSFTARKVVFFEIFDVTSTRYRQFYSIPFSQTGGYKTPTFFELLAEGKLTLLAKEALEYKNYSSGYYGYGSISRLVLVNKYFVLNEKGNIEIFSGLKKVLIDLMANRDDEIKKFIKVNKLNLESKYDLSRIFDYYNSLFGKK